MGVFPYFCESTAAPLRMGQRFSRDKDKGSQDDEPTKGCFKSNLSSNDSDEPAPPEQEPEQQLPIQFSADCPLKERMLLYTPALQQNSETGTLDRATVESWIRATGVDNQRDYNGGKVNCAVPEH